MKHYLTKIAKWVALLAGTIFISCALSICLIKFAAHRGDPRAQATLSYMYFWGAGVKKNKAHSVKWGAKAAGSSVKKGIGKVFGAGKTIVKKTGSGIAKIARALAFWKKKGAKKVA